MAKYRIKWRHIWRNLGKIIILVQTLMASWPAVKSRMKITAQDDPHIGAFYWAADDLYNTILRRRK